MTKIVTCISRTWTSFSLIFAAPFFCNVKICCLCNVWYSMVTDKTTISSKKTTADVYMADYGITSIVPKKMQRHSVVQMAWS